MVASIERQKPGPKDKVRFTEDLQRWRVENPKVTLEKIVEVTKPILKMATLKNWVGGRYEAKVSTLRQVLELQGPPGGVLERFQELIRLVLGIAVPTEVPEPVVSNNFGLPEAGKDFFNVGLLRQAAQKIGFDPLSGEVTLEQFATHCDSWAARESDKEAAKLFREASFEAERIHRFQSTQPLLDGISQESVSTWLWDLAQKWHNGQAVTLEDLEGRTHESPQDLLLLGRVFPEEYEEAAMACLLGAARMSEAPSASKGMAIQAGDCIAEVLSLADQQGRLAEFYQTLSVGFDGNCAKLVRPYRAAVKLLDRAPSSWLKLVELSRDMPGFLGVLLYCSAFLAKEEDPALQITVPDLQSYPPEGQELARITLERATSIL